MKRSLLASLAILSAIGGAPISHAEQGEVPAYCSFSFGPSEQAPPNPLPWPDYGLGPTVLPVVWCQGDVDSIRSYWRSFRDHYGCSAETEVGQAIEMGLVEWPYLQDYADSRAVLENNPEICAQVLACTIPSEYSPEESPEDLQCLIDAIPFR